MIILAAITGVLALIIVGLPFFVGPGGALASAASENSPKRLESIKQAIVKRYLEEQKFFENKTISARVWETRKNFLIKRYVDAARRLDFLTHLGKENE